MSCIVHYRTKVEEKIQDAFGVGRTSARLLPNKKILLPVNPENPQLADKANVVKWAERVIESLQKRFRSDIFGNMVEIDKQNYPKAVLISYNVPMKLIEHYINKYATPVRKKQAAKVIEKTDNPEVISKVNLMLELPASFREEHWEDIKMMLDDDAFSTENMKDLIEHLKTCK